MITANHSILRGCILCKLLLIRLHYRRDAKVTAYMCLFHKRYNVIHRVHAMCARSFKKVYQITLPHGRKSHCLHVFIHKNYNVIHRVHARPCNVHKKSRDGNWYVTDIFMQAHQVTTAQLQGRKGHFLNVNFIHKKCTKPQCV